MYDLFNSGNFLFRTNIPELLDAKAIDALLDDRTRLIEHGGLLAGMWSFRSLDPHNWGISHFSGFYQLAYRLRDDLPITSWIEGYNAILGYLSSKNDVIRVAFPVLDFDELGNRAAMSMGFTREGTIEETAEVGTRVRGTIVYSRTYSPDVYVRPHAA
ncbi:hypothetical protein LFM09_15855 [Lentzea alba]|uniref:hypothetical protein n=1 Tax=Lentzea alba TaxID=2714351 RepID=UPI0039BF4866